MLTRRSLLRSTLAGAPLMALAPSIPCFLTQSARAAAPGHDRRILVVIELNGGNDGLNTVVPFADEGYARHRKTLRIATDRVLKIDDRRGLHPAMRAAADLVEDGRMTIIQGVGYPNPDRSHFRSMAIWQSARMDHAEHDAYGWLGRALDAQRNPNDGPRAVCVGAVEPPLAIRGRRSVHATVERMEDLQLRRAARPVLSSTETPGDDLAAFVRRRTADALTTADRLKDLAKHRDAESPYPATKLGDQMLLLSKLIKADLGPRVFYTVQSGYDTHAHQLNLHARLVDEFSSAVKAFLDDLRQARLEDRVMVLAFSEFGRRVAENASAGTDHGTAGPVFLAGAELEHPLAGAAPDLDDLEDGDLKMSLDFRQVYATLLEQWLQVPSKEALGGAFEPLPLIRTS